MKQVFGQVSIPTQYPDENVTKSEYWKSQPKKFCDFCKCWITDNKPSVQFHEKGKRHQENVRLKIEEVKQKGTADAKRKEEENDFFQQMEKAALEAFKKDISDNPDLAKQYNVRVPPDKDAVYEGPQLPDDWEEQLKANKKKKEEEESEAESATKEGWGKQEGEWYEAMSEMGYPYYWNTVTGESIWVAPAKYVTLKDQGLAPSTDEEASGETAKKQVDEAKDSVEAAPALEDIPLPPGVEAIPLPGEATQPDPPQPETESEEEEEEEEEEAKQDRNARGMYGTWARVREEQAAQVDLQLPKMEAHVETVSVPVLAPEERLKFKEKRVTLSSSSSSSKKAGPVAFKKRKLGDGARNVRRRDTDD